MKSGGDQKWDSRQEFRLKERFEEDFVFVRMISAFQDDNRMQRPQLLRQIRVETIFQFSSGKFPLVIFQCGRFN